MTEVKLLSIKIKPEHAYFYENDGATFDSNGNNVVVSNKPSKNEQRKSKKLQKAAEKEQKKQQKKELKQRKQESRKSTKKNSSPKDENHEVSSNSKSDKTAKENGEVNLPQFSNPVFYDGTLEKPQEVNIQENASAMYSAPEIIGENVEPETSGENVEPETSGENVQPNSLVADAKEEAITCENAEQPEEEPRDISWQFKPNPQITTLEQGQHVEVEISEITELEDMPDGNGMSSETVIAVTIVQEVESGADLDSFFIEVYGEAGMKESKEKRKIVRFEEPQPTEQETDNRTEDSDDKTENADGEDEVIEVKREEPPVDECVGDGRISNGDSCHEIDLDQIFESCEKEAGPNTTEVGNHRIEIAGDDVTLNGKPSGAGHEEIASKTEKRKKGGLLKCCFS